MHSHSPLSDGAIELIANLRDGKPRTRARLAELAGVARSTISLRVEELESTGLLQTDGEAVYTGGRPSSRVALSPTAFVVIAADIGATHASVALLNLLGTPLASEMRTVTDKEAPESVLRWMLERGKAMAAKLGLATEQICSAGIGLAAPIEATSRRPINPPVMPLWDGFDVRGWVENHLGAPTLVEKDVNLMVVGEHVTRWATVTDLLFVKISTGVGAGMILSGNLHRGSAGIAGDIGHVQVSGAEQVPCHCGNRGCLEAVASVPALARQLRTSERDVRSAQDVIDLVKIGDLDAVQAVRQAGKHLGEVLASTVSLLNPSVVVIGGALSRAGEHLLAGAREVVYARSMPLATQRLTLAPADDKVDVAILGAGILAADYALSADGLRDPLQRIA